MRLSDLLEDADDNISNEEIKVAENIDRLITVDVSLRGVIEKLYQAARKRVELPLTLAAARALVNSVNKKDVVFIATGWPDRPHISPQIWETDGPPGALVLAKSMHVAFNAVPFFLVGENLTKHMGAVVQASGLKVLEPDQSIKAVDSSAPIHVASVIGFPTDTKQADDFSAYLINEYRPSAIVSVEKGGMNSKGVIHTSRGHDTTEHMAKIDFLIRQAEEKGILTIGIGDGGNEIGMGNIQEDLREWLPFGKKCECPCESGIVPSTVTDYLVTSAVSNWGAYGIAACLAILRKNPKVFHDPELEHWIFTNCANAGLIDGVSGYVTRGADGLSAEIHASLVTILGKLVEVSLHASKGN